MIKRQALLLAAIAAGLSMTPAMAETAGTWTVGVGAGYVDPDSDNGTLLNGALKTEVDSEWKACEISEDADVTYKPYQEYLK